MCCYVRTFRRFLDSFDVFNSIFAADRLHMHAAKLLYSISLLDLQFGRHPPEQYRWNPDISPQFSK